MIAAVAGLIIGPAGEVPAKPMNLIKPLEIDILAGQSNMQGQALNGWHRDLVYRFRMDRRYSEPGCQGGNNEEREDVRSHTVLLQGSLRSVMWRVCVT